MLRGAVRGVTNAVKGVNRITRAIRNDGRGTTTTGRKGTSKKKPTGLKNANKNNVDKTKVKDTGYINGVEDFAPKETPVQPVYHYGYNEKADIGSGYAGLGESEDEEFIEEEQQEPDLWEDVDVLTEEDEEYFQEKIESISNENIENRNEVLKHYIGIQESLDTEGGQVAYEIQRQVADLLMFTNISHVPTFLNERADYEKVVKGKVEVEGIPKEEIDKYIEQELDRYESVINDFIPIIKKGDKYFIDDWKIGIKAIDFMVKSVKYPEYLVLLSDAPLYEQVYVMGEAYLPPVLQETPFKKIFKMFMELAKDIENDNSGKDYQFKKAYMAYKRRLPLYKRLRNNGNFPNVSVVMNDFYKVLDNTHVNSTFEGDAYLGLIEEKEFITAYTTFFYGKAKQTKTMGELTEKLMRQNPNVLLNMTDSGYTDADDPEGAFIVFAGHIVTFIPFKSGGYISTIDKAPSNITGEDIKTLAGMVSKEKKKPKKQAKKVEPKKEPVVDRESGDFGNYYDHAGALKLFEEKKNNPTPKKKAKPKKKVEPKPEEVIEPEEVEEEIIEPEEVIEPELVEEKPYIEYINMLERKESIQVKLVTGGVVNIFGGVIWSESVNGYTVYMEDYTDGYEYDEVVIKTPEEAMDEIIYWLTKGDKSLEENLKIEKVK